MVTSFPPLPAEDIDSIVESTAGLWEGMKGGRLFLTGGSGFFGSWLLESFLAANDRFSLGAEVTLLTRDPAGFLARNPFLKQRADLSLVEGDIRSFDFPPGHFSHVIHAGAAPGGNLSAIEMFDTIVEGTRRVLDFARTAGTRRLLFISSGGVYGPPPYGSVQLAEDHPSAPDPLLDGSAYGEGKRAAEFLCQAVGREAGIEIKIARCFAFVGPRLPLDGAFAIGNFIRDALAGEPVRVCGDGTPVRSYLYASDLAVWLWNLLFRGPSFRAFNVGSDHALDLAALASRVQALLNAPRVEVAGSASAGLAPSCYVPDIGRIRREFGLEPVVLLDDAIEKTARWWRSVPGFK